MLEKIERPIHDTPIFVYSYAVTESNCYASRKTHLIPPSDSIHYPTLKFLFKHAVWVLHTYSRPENFTYARVEYAIVWVGKCMCVMHVASARILVGGLDYKHEELSQLEKETNMPLADV